MPRTNPGVDRGRNERIDIAINEKGASVAVRKLYQLADSLQKISPAAARSLRGKALRVGLNIDQMVKDVASAVLEKVVSTTPHDTGRARANWQTAVRISRPISEPEWEKYDYEGTHTIEDGKALIQSSPRPDGSTVYISNSLPYIKALNDGWSKQAPANFVELAVQAGSQAVSNSKVLK
jgi:hypothetical protein